MKSSTYRGTQIVTDGYCFYVSFEGREEEPFDTMAQAQAYIDWMRYNKTLHLMAKS